MSDNAGKNAENATRMQATMQRKPLQHNENAENAGKTYSILQNAGSACILIKQIYYTI
ncbi:MAG: hypothetical protein PHY48_13305 [Candidatus Cloacimonetes bacterium]|jgi:hypothetical protein|nr:hypothetical protein [Candidatus Cloacimonadota bacterium]